MTIHTFYFDARLTRLSSLMPGAAQPLGRLEHFCEPILGESSFSQCCSASMQPFPPLCTAPFTSPSSQVSENDSCHLHDSGASSYLWPQKEESLARVISPSRRQAAGSEIVRM